MSRAAWGYLWKTGAGFLLLLLLIGLWLFERKLNRPRLS